jgi:hypothetical protein
MGRNHVVNRESNAGVGSVGRNIGIGERVGAAACRDDRGTTQKTLSGSADSEHQPFGHVRWFIEAVRAFQVEATRRADDPKSRNYAVHFEIDDDPTPATGDPQ